MVYFEHIFKDGTAIRIVDIPDTSLEREVPTLELRVSTGPKSFRKLPVPLYDYDTKEDLFEELVEGLLKQKIKEIGKECENCAESFLPNSPAQKCCPACIELRS